MNYWVTHNIQETNTRDEQFWIIDQNYGNINTYIQIFQSSKNHAHDLAPKMKTQVFKIYTSTKATLT